MIPRDRQRRLTDWLSRTAGPVIRYRTALELRGVRRAELEPLERELLRSTQVRTWLDRIGRDVQFFSVHGHKPTALENPFGKLALLGCRAGMKPLDRRVAPMLRWVARAAPPESDPVHGFTLRLVVCLLEVTGYGDSPAVADILLPRLDKLAAFARAGRYDIYVDSSRFAGYPSAFGSTPLVDPALYPDGELPLPSIWDLYALASLRARKEDPGLRRKIDAVVRYVMSPDYASLAPGYGAMRMGKRRFWKIGWHLPLPESEDSGRPSSGAPATSALQNLELVARFPGGRRSAWCSLWLRRLEGWTTQDGTYLFPRGLLAERRSGYWVLGSYMGLEENRRSRQALELESTFRILKLTRLMSRRASAQGGRASA